jgi:glycosyltransferase involved in cell wall biosynthesis
MIFPCFNPPETWKETFLLYSKSLISSLVDIHFQFVIVDDGSTKGITEADKHYVSSHLPNCIFITHEINKGKGQAIRTGVDACSSGLIIYCDIDYPFGVEPFTRLISKLNAGSQVVFGKRDHTYHQKLPFLRRFISVAFQWINLLIIPASLSGCQAGIMGFHYEVKPLFLTTKINRFLFSTEFARIIHKQKLTYRCVGLSLRDIEPHTTINKKSMLQEFSNLLYLLTHLNIFKF